MFHAKCSDTNKKPSRDLKRINGNVLPFSDVDNNELFLEKENKAKLLNSTPSFTIQSLLDEMPGPNFKSDEFMGKAFTPAEFLQA